MDIIIPAYNAERYIAQCVESVLSQETAYSFRVLAIDDGSTDSTGDILDGYDGITVIHQENRGFSGARNRGIELATAEYLMFLDADDVLCPGAIEKLMSTAKKNNAGIVEGTYTEVDLNGKPIKRHRHEAGKISPIGGCSGYAWGKIIKRELFSELVFPEGYWYEDSVMRQVLYPLAIKREYPVWGISENVILYRQNPSGITQKGRGSNKSLDSLYITMQLYNDRQMLDLPTTKEYYDYILSMAVQTYRRTRMLRPDIQQAIFIVYRAFILRYFDGWHTENKKLACLEKAIRERDYGNYLAYCQLH